MQGTVRSILNENWQARDTPLAAMNWGRISMSQSHSLLETTRENRENRWVQPLEFEVVGWCCLHHFSCPLDGTIISQILKPNNQDTLKDMPFVPRRKGVSLFVLDVIGRCKRRSSHPPNRWNIYWPQLSQKKNVFCLYLTVCLSSRHIWRNIIASQ